MPYPVPTLRTLIDRAIADLDARLPGASARLPESNLNVLAFVQAGASNGLYGYIGFLARQIIPDTAEIEFLERWASIWGITRKAAAPAAGSVTFTGTNGTNISAGVFLQRADGVQYQTSAAGVIAAGVLVLAVVAVVPGLAGNALAGSVLSLVSPISGVDSSAAVTTGGLVSGSDSESDTALRARFLARIQQPPQGGADFDYIAWALEVAGVTRAWVYPSELGLGTVTVRFVRDNDASLIPDAAEVTAVQNYINARRPVTAAVSVFAPIAQPLNLTIALTPNTAAVQASVRAELADLILREAEPGATILLSHLREAISVASGESDSVLSVPSANVTHATGYIATLGTITWL